MSGTSTTMAADRTRAQLVRSPGGIEAYLVTERSVPFLSLALAFKGGSALDPAGQEGLANMAAGLIDEGAGRYDSQAFRRELEDNAIRLVFSADRNGFTGSLRTLTDTRSHAFELLRLALTEARFDAEPVERIRAQIRADLARRESDPDYVVTRHWFASAFAGHPYGRPVRGTPESLGGIGASELRAMIRGSLVKDRLSIGVAGDIDADELAPLLDATFGGLVASAGPISLVDAGTGAGRVEVVSQPNPQSTVLFGHRGVARLDPDYYAAYTANYILGGGGFASRLTEEIREKRGLAYSVYSYLYDLDQAPLWLGGVATSNERVAESMRLVRQEMARLAAGELEAEELGHAKTYLTGSFPLRLTSNDQVASMVMGMQQAGLGIDYLERRNALVEAVTLADVRRVAGTLFRPENLVVAVVGEPQGLTD